MWAWIVKIIEICGTLSNASRERKLSFCKRLNVLRFCWWHEDAYKATKPSLRSVSCSTQWQKFCSHRLLLAFPTVYLQTAARLHPVSCENRQNTIELRRRRNSTRQDSSFRPESAGLNQVHGKNHQGHCMTQQGKLGFLMELTDYEEPTWTSQTEFPEERIRKYRLCTSLYGCKYTTKKRTK